MKKKKMNTTKKIVVALAVMIVAAAMAAPAAMGVEYSATVTTNQNTALTASDGAFGDVVAGTSSHKDMTIQLKNIGNTPAKVTASGANFTDGGVNSFAVTNLKINSTSVTNAGAVVVTSVPADGATHDYAGDLSIPSLQPAATYNTTVDLTFANAA